MTGTPPNVATAVVDHLTATKVVPVLRSATADQAVTAARGFARGGISVVELTYSTPGVLDAVRELSGDGSVLIGVGSILTEQQAHDAVDAGARFLVSPILLHWLPALARNRGVGSIPGAATPTEIWQAHDLGATAVKVFPIARLGGATYIRDLLAPLPDLRLMATGGIDLPAARQLLTAGCIAVGVGTIATETDGASDSDEVRARRFLAALQPPSNHG